MTEVRFDWELSPEALLDFAEIVQWSDRKFGRTAALRYEDLLIQAILDIADDPLRAGAKLRTDLSADPIYIYHIAYSRNRVRGEKVQRPRHLLLYRTRPQVVMIGRILHDSRDLARHLPEVSMPD